jgi:tetratricopeptide (TPR) repeat protein
LCLLSWVHIRQGQLDEARLLLQQAQDQLSAEPNLYQQGLTRWTQALLAAAERRWEEAIASFGNAAQCATQTGDRWYAARVFSDWAEAHIARGSPGDQVRAQELYQEALATFEQLQIPRYAARVRERLQALAPKSAFSG